MPPAIEGLYQVTRGIRCLVAPNPSAMTGCGTNTYLLHTGVGTVVIDPGPALPAHLSRLLSAIGSTPVAAILVTHAHLDHSALAATLGRETQAPVLAFGTCLDGRSTTMQKLAAAGLTGGGEGVDKAFNPHRRLADGERLVFGTQTVEVLHCPGHMGGHLCFAADSILFSGDHVMGWASSMISPPDGDMTDYMASLARLASRQWTYLLPGHGAPVVKPAARLAELITHRLTREAAVLNALRSGHRSVQEIARHVYQGTPEALMPAAQRNVLAHLYDLVAKNIVESREPHSATSTFRLPQSSRDYF